MGQGLSVANNLLANQASLNLNRNQASLQTSVNRLSSGLRINSAADDPSGLAIATTLQTQVDGFQQAVQNVQNANNAATVAEGALQTTTDILQRIRSLAVEASSDITSTADKANLQVEVNQLLLEVNRISQNTNFNGQQLLDGSHEGFQAAVNATLTITANSALATNGGGSTQAGFLINTAVSLGTSFNTTSGGVQGVSGGTGTVDGTVELQVINTGVSIAVQETFVNSATGAATVSTVLFGSGGTTAANSYDNVNITIGNITTADVGVTAYVKVSQQVAALTDPTKPAFNFQSGANEGATVQVGFAATNTSTLRVSNINLVLSTSNSGSIGAEDAIGQIDQALQTLLQQRATLGAVIVRLNEDAANDNIAAVNLQASESSIRDLNVGAETTNFTKLQILVQVGTSVLAQSNSNAQSVLGLFR
jgi:flagellin